MLKVLADTSIIFAALLKPHPQHGDAVPYLRQAEAGELRLVVSTHCLAETYSSLTAVPAPARMGPAVAQQMLSTSIFPFVETVELSTDDYRLAMEHMVRLGLVSGAIYDALHVRAAEKAECDELITFNGRDFRRMPPAPPTRLVIL